LAAGGSPSAVAVLASPDVAFVTVHVLTVDGVHFMAW
jgi:hypothetical protein